MRSYAERMLEASGFEGAFDKVRHASTVGDLSIGWVGDCGVAWDVGWRGVPKAFHPLCHDIQPVSRLWAPEIALNGWSNQRIRQVVSRDEYETTVFVENDFGDYVIALPNDAPVRVWQWDD